MKITKKNKLKDKILSSIKNKWLDVNQIAKKTKLDSKLVAYLLEELESEKLIRLNEVTTKDSETPRDYLAKISNKGIFLLDVDGGFSKINNQLILNNVWQILKILLFITTEFYCPAGNCGNNKYSKKLMYSFEN
ncbi:MAG: hypothetical protein GX876_08805 [Bacteroidales bacterium]|nr:hypothetical protein [Bacteroidales bacterium]